MKKKTKASSKMIKNLIFLTTASIDLEFFVSREDDSETASPRRHLLLAVRQKAGGRAIELEFYFKINQLLQLYLIFIYIVITFSET